MSLSVDRGRTLGLVGESGCGKTTLGMALLRLVEPTGGRVEFDGVEMHSLQADALLDVRRRMQIFFQDPYSSLNPRQTAGDIVRSPLDVQRVGSPAEREARVAELFSLVGLRANQRNLFPPPVLGRPAATHQHRQGTGVEPRLHRLRRTGVGAGRRDPGPDSEPAVRTCRRS